MQKLNFVQIQCVSVPNTASTQCNVMMYGLDNNGKVWVKRDCDTSWQPEPMEGKNNG